MPVISEVLICPRVVPEALAAKSLRPNQLGGYGGNQKPAGFVPAEEESYFYSLDDKLCSKNKEDGD